MIKIRGEGKEKNGSQGGGKGKKREPAKEVKSGDWRYGRRVS